MKLLEDFKGIGMRFWTAVVQMHMPSVLICMLLELAVMSTYVFLFRVNEIKATFGIMYTLRILTYFIGIVLSWGIIYSKPKIKNRSYNIFSVVISLLFSFFITLGTSDFITQSTELCWGNIIIVFVWCLQMALISMLLFPIIRYVLRVIQSYNMPKNEERTFNYKKLWIITLLSRLIALMFFFPVLFDFDAGFGLRAMLDSSEIVSNHHPYAVQWIHYIFYEIGVAIGDPKYGMGFLSLCWITISSAIIVYAVTVMEKMDTSRRMLNIVAYTFSIFPFFILLSIYCTKDGFFAYSFLLFQAIVLKICITNAQCLKSLKYLLLYTISIIALCLTRHQGIYIAIIETILLMLVKGSGFKRAAALSMPGIVIVMLFVNVLLPLSDVSPTNKRETYGMFFQQSARCIIDHPNDIDAEDYQAIDAILPIDSITNRYLYNSTDFVKMFYYYRHIDSVRIHKAFTDSMYHNWQKIEFPKESEDLAAYRKAWLRMGVKHPKSYIDANLGVISPYFYNECYPLIILSHDWSNSSATCPKYAFTQQEKNIDCADAVLRYIPYVPVIGLFGGFPLYIWINIFLIAIIVWRRDYKGLVIFSPVIVSMAVLVLTPVATGRYLWPIVATLPILFVYVLHNKAKYKMCSISKDKTERYV